MYVGEAEARAKSGNAVVGTGGSGFGGDADGGPGDRLDGGGGRDIHNRNYDGQLIKWGGYCSKHNLRDRA